MAPYSFEDVVMHLSWYILYFLLPLPMVLKRLWKVLSLACWFNISSVIGYVPSTTSLVVRKAYCSQSTSKHIRMVRSLGLYFSSSVWSTSTMGINSLIGSMFLLNISSPYIVSGTK